MQGSATLAQAVRAHSGEVTCLDAAGARLVTGGGDRALRLWLWEAGGGWRREAEAAAAHRYGVTALRFGRGGALLASGGVDGALRVWAAAGLAARRQLAAPGAAAVRAVCWAGGGGARLLAGHDDGAVRVWAVPRATLLATLQAHEGALHALATLARDALLLTACTDGVLKVFDLAAVCKSGSACESTIPEGGGCGGGGSSGPGALQWIDGAHDMGALCAAASEGSELCATGGHDALICVWRVGGGAGCAPPALPLQAAGVLAGHTAAVTSLHWAGAVLASASLDRTARLWAPAQGACLQIVAAHPRYLTCVYLVPDLRYMITGSNDKSFRMWSLGSLTLDDDLETPCEALAHFGLGDLEGIGPVEEEEGSEGDANRDPGELDPEEERGSGASRVWSTQAHGGAINCIATSGQLIATASSDGTVKVWQWEGEAGGGVQLHSLEAHRYPALGAEFGRGGAVVVTCGLDGSALVWDVVSGVAVRTLAAPAGGGVRAARLSPHSAPLLLLATDDGLAPLWALADPDPHPIHVYSGHADAVTCCAWSGDGRAAATGAASGELRLWAPPRHTLLHHDSHAHDLGVSSCDFAPPSDSIVLPEGSYLLATAGCDSFVKLWRIDLQEEEESACVTLARQVAAHGGAVESVRWGAGRGAALLASAGADRWARVWRVAARGAGAHAEPIAAVPARGAGGALAAALARDDALLAVGSLAGELALWRLDSASITADEDAGAPPTLWGEAGVLRWVRDYIVHAPGANMSAHEAAELESRVRAAGLTGVRLLQDDVKDLLQTFGFEDENINSELEVSDDKRRTEHRERFREELQWLRADPPPLELVVSAPHWLLCPLRHRLVREPARAADGFSYERDDMLEWLLAAPPEGAASPVCGRRLRSAALAPNYALRDALRAFLRAAERAPDTAPLPQLSG